MEPWPLTVQGAERRIFRYDLEPGQVVTDSIRLTNKTDQTRRFRVRAVDASLREDGTVNVEGTGSSPDAAGRWISTEREELGLLPRTSEVVDFEVRRPRSSTGSGVAAIVAEEVAEQPDGGGIEVRYRVAILVRLDGEATGLAAGTPRLTSEIAVFPRSAQASTSLTNETLQDVDVTTRFTVTSLTGRVWILEPVHTMIPSGDQVAVSQTWSTVPRWGGAFRVTAESEWDIGTVAATGPRSVTVPLWLLGLLILAVGVRGLREMGFRRQGATRSVPDGSVPDLEALRERLIEAALQLNTAGRDAPRELREATASEAEAIAAQARRAPDGRDIERAARSLAEFARNLDDEISARQAAGDLAEWFREHRDDPRVKELVGS